MSLSSNHGERNIFSLKSNQEAKADLRLLQQGGQVEDVAAQQFNALDVVAER